MPASPFPGAAVCILGPGRCPPGRARRSWPPHAAANASASAGLFDDGFLGNLDHQSAFIALLEAFIDLFIFMAAGFCCIVSVGLCGRFRC